MNLIIGITGASGSIYAQRFIEIVHQNQHLFENIAVIFTDIAKKVWNYEIDDYPIEQIPFKIYDNNDYFVAPASGSCKFDTMVILPCTMGTMSKIANSLADNLLTRAADVMLKENRTLVIVPRETPLNIIHIENMKKIIFAGGIICPAMPSFYSKPKSINDLVDTVIQKVLQLIGIEIKFFEWMKNKSL